MNVRKEEFVSVDPECFAPMGSNPHSMRYTMLKHAYRALAANQFNRVCAARSIGISIRTMRNMIQEMRAAGWIVPASTFTIADANRARQEKIHAREAAVETNSMSSRYQDVLKTKPDPGIPGQ